MDLIIFVLTVLVPGYLLFRVFYEEVDLASVLPISTSLGLTLLFFASFPTYLLAKEFSFGMAIVATYTLVLLFIVLKKSRLFSNITFKWDFISSLLLIVVVGSLLVMFFIAPHLDADALYHLAQIRKLAENNPITPFEASFPIQKISPAYGYNVWYFAVGMSAFFSGVDVISVWSHLIFILVPATLLALFVFAFYLFKDRLVAFSAVVLYVFLFGYLQYATQFRISPYPDQVGRNLVLFVSLLFFLKFMENKKNKDFFLTVFLTFSLSAIHLYSWVHFLIVAASFSIFLAIFKSRNSLKSGAKVISAVVLLTLPYLWIKMYGASSVIEPHYVKKTFVTIFGHFYYLNPFFISWTFYLTLLVLIFLALKYRSSFKEKTWLIFLVSNGLAGLFLIFNPLLTPVVGKIITLVYTRRLTYLVYIELIWSAFLVFEVLELNEKIKLPPWFKKTLAVAAALIVILVPANFINSKTNTNNDQETNQLMNFIKNSLPPKAVFAAGDWLSLRIPAYTNSYIVMASPNNTTWNVNKIERQNDLKMIFSSEVGLKKTKTLFDKYDVDYVIVSKKVHRYDIATNFDKFKNDSSFKRIYDQNYYIVYSYKK